MPKRKEPERSREEQEQTFEEAAKKSGADLSGRSFASAMRKIAEDAKTKRHKSRSK